MRSLIALLLVSTSVLAQDLVVENIRVWDAPDNTRVVLDISRSAEYKLFTLDRPHRVVIDVHNTKLNALAIPSGTITKYLSTIRTGIRNHQDLRIVLVLAQAVQVKHFQLKPNKRYGHRLVVDLSDPIDPHKPAALPAEPSLTTTRDVLRDVVIAIDAGHGGDDPGALGPKGNFEKDVVLQLSKKLANKVNMQRGMRAFLVREGDYFISLRERIKKARKHKADLFISVHADAFKDPTVHGSSVYVLSQKGASSEAAKWLAEQENSSDLIGGVSLEDKDDLLKSVLLDLSQTASLEASLDVADRILFGLKGIGDLHKRTVQSAGFAVLKSPDIPSVLVETGFISNPAEEKKLLNTAYQDKLVDAIASSLHVYFKDFAPQNTIFAIRRHTIEKGDTLSAIAQRYKISLQRLRRFNGINGAGDLLHIGQTLNIPNANGS